MQYKISTSADVKTGLSQKPKTVIYYALICETEFYSAFEKYISYALTC